MHGPVVIPSGSICLETRAGLQGRLQWAPEPSSSLSSQRSGLWSGRGVWGLQSLTSVTEFLLS